MPSQILLTPEARREIAREKWRLAKRMQRNRNKPGPLPVCPVFREAVFDERDRRGRSSFRARRVVNGIYVEVAGQLAWFAANVWAARVMLRAEWGEGADTPSRIARWLWDKELSTEYARSSLRPRIYAAIKIIADLERHGNTPSDPPFWEPWEFLYDRESVCTGDI